MPDPILQLQSHIRQPRLAAILRRLPRLEGAPITLEAGRGLTWRGRPSHATAFLRERRIVFDCSRAEFPRIFVHELFHFAWLRVGNPARLEWERLLRREMAAGARGELGWSAEWRKRALTGRDRRTRSRRWREYCCESFCDTAAWLYSGATWHSEFTLAVRFGTPRRAWFMKTFANGRLPL